MYFLYSLIYLLSLYATRLLPSELRTFFFFFSFVSQSRSAVVDVNDDGKKTRSIGMESGYIIV